MKKDGALVGLFVRYIRYANAFLFTIFVSGCVTMQPASIEELTAEVSTIVKNDMPLTQVTIVLRSRGFSCNEGTSINPRGKGIFECTRSRGGFLYSCIHRIWFEGSTTGGTVKNFQIHKPACASL